ncbi:MAG: tRNA lysidine(34) synthetase TilS [Anaerolineae bacterium]
MARTAVGPQQDVASAVSEAICRYELLRHGDRVVVGFSGGPDSLALLHILQGLQDELDIRVYAAHLNHSLRGSDADADAEFARRTCLAWGVPLVIEQEDVAALAQERGLAIEEAARQARYAFLARVAQEVGASAVAVGHNADDQVETVLMHLLRGSGLAGLRGMVPSLPLADLHILGKGDVPPNLRLIRPLLAVPRSAILQYCQQHGLSPRFDLSNLDKTYFRNRLRHELIPYLEGFNPRIREIMRRSASVLSADCDYLRQQRERAWGEVVERADSQRVLFTLPSFQGLHLSLRRALIRQAIAWLRPPLRNIDMIHVEQAVQALDEDRGAGVKVTLPNGLMLTISYGRFAIADESLANPFDGEYPQLPSADKALPVPVPGEVILPDDWRLAVEITARAALPAEALAAEHPWLAYLDLAACLSVDSRQALSAGSGQAPVGLVLRSRHEGERIQPLGLGGHSKKLNELMINLKIPTAYRERYPLLAGPKHILWLPGYHVDHRARVTAATEWILVARMVRAKKEPGYLSGTHAE